MSGNEMKPTDSPQGSHHVRQEQHHHEGTQPMERALSPDLQELVDKAEKDRELYEDSWTNPTFETKSLEQLSSSPDNNRKKDESGSQSYSSIADRTPAVDKKNTEVKDQ